MKTNKKIDFSNEDHCGPCGQNLLNLNKDIKIKDKWKILKDVYVRKHMASATDIG